MTEPHQFWQTLHAPGSFSADGPFTDAYVAELPDRRQLLLPIRVLDTGDRALASLIINQASFAVQDALAAMLAESIAAAKADVVVGLPTLGLTLAAAVARRLGHDRYVPLGTSRKFWYRDTLSVPLSSITTPGPGKRLYIDPRMLPLLEGRRVALIDDVVSSGTSMLAGLSLLTTAGVEPVILGAAMLQSDRWREGFDALDRIWSDRLAAVFATPLLTPAAGGGWQAPP